MRHCTTGELTSTFGRRRSQQRGVALVLAMLVILLMSVMGIALMYVATTEYRLAVNETRVSSAMYAAESGIEYAAAMLRVQGHGYHGGRMPVLVSGSGVDFVVDISTPVPVTAKTVLRDVVGDGQVGWTETTYAVTSRAHATSWQIECSLEAWITVVPGKSSQIVSWKEKRR